MARSLDIDRARTLLANWTQGECLCANCNNVLRALAHVGRGLCEPPDEHTRLENIERAHFTHGPADAYVRGREAKFRGQLHESRPTHAAQQLRHLAERCGCRTCAEHSANLKRWQLVRCPRDRNLDLTARVARAHGIDFPRKAIPTPRLDRKRRRA